jgi:outer membrane lipoprotein-sorting protein
MKTIQNLSITVLVILLGFTQGFAQMNGQEIMEAVYNNPSGENIQGQLEMRLINKQGDTRVRELQQFIKDEGEVEKTIMFFLSPADVRNTSFMNWSYNDGRDDDQWIYLPALKRVKRISSDSKSDNFMGSDFTYDDLGDRHPNEDAHKLLGEEVFNGYDCYIVESVPKDKDYMYSKTVTWVIKENFIGIKRDFYDEDGDLLKILQIKKFEKISGYWVILNTQMHNVQKDHRTEMIFSEVELDQPIPSNKFTERSMTLGR